MAEDTPAAAPEAAAKAQKKKAATQPKKEAQTKSLRLMVINTVDSSKDRKGTSMPNIKKCLKAEGVDVIRDNKRINNTVKKLVDQGTLIQTNGAGASGSFKLAKTDTTPAKKTPTDAKKTRTTKTTAKKTTVNIVGAKKSSKKGIDKTVATKPKTPRKSVATTQKAAAAAKTSSPKKKTASEKMRPAKKNTAKKNAAKKSAPKKGSKK